VPEAFRSCRDFRDSPRYEFARLTHRSTSNHDLEPRKLEGRVGFELREQIASADECARCVAKLKPLQWLSRRETEDESVTSKGLIDGRPQPYIALNHR